MSYQIKFDFCRPLGTRVVDVPYVSPAICPVLYYGERIVSSSNSLDEENVL